MRFNKIFTKEDAWKLAIEASLRREADKKDLIGQWSDDLIGYRHMWWWLNVGLGFVVIISHYHTNVSWESAIEVNENATHKPL